MAEVQQPPRPGVPLVGGHQRRLDCQAPGDDGRPVRRVGFKRVQQPGVLNKPVFDDLRHAAPQLTPGQRSQTVRIGDHQPGLIERAQQVLALRQIHRRFTAHGTVHLREQRGGQLRQRHAPLIAGGDKARHVAGDAAAQRQQSVASGKALLRQLAAQGEPRLRGLVRLSRREGQQLAGKSRAPQAVQHRAAVQRRHRFIRRDGPAVNAQRRQQCSGLPQRAGLDMNGIAALRQRDGHGHEKLPPNGHFFHFTLHCPRCKVAEQHSLPFLTESCLRRDGEMDAKFGKKTDTMHPAYCFFGENRV